MEASDERVRRVIALRDKLEEKIGALREELEFLESNMEAVESLLKQSSFAKASTLGRAKPEPEEEPEAPGAEAVPMTRGSGGDVIANAYIEPDRLSIVVNEEVSINPETAPFQSFFMNRIIAEMKQKDEREEQDIIDCILTKNGPNLREIIIKNYRSRERANELISTASWSFTKMLENVGR